MYFYVMDPEKAQTTELSQTAVSSAKMVMSAAHL
jgi:hypothetical protein